jgi:putative endonuclease
MFSEPGSYFVYILASQTRVLYTGVTNDLYRRVYQHQQGLIPGFTSQYRVTHLVFFERHLSSRAAVARERQIKGWSRSKKLELIEQNNAGWIDLAADWFRK